MCGAEAYKILKSCGQDTTCGATYAVVGRFLAVTLPASAGPPFICAMIVRSTAYAPTLNENHKQGTLPYTASECAEAEGVVLAAFDASVREARQ